MRTTTGERYARELKLDVVRLIKAGQAAVATTKILAISEETLPNWVKADTDCRRAGAGPKPLSPAQMGIARRRAESTRVKMECDILAEATDAPTTAGQVS